MANSNVRLAIASATLAVVMVILNALMFLTKPVVHHDSRMANTARPIVSPAITPCVSIKTGFATEVMLRLSLFLTSISISSSLKTMIVATIGKA